MIYSKNLPLHRVLQACLLFVLCVLPAACGCETGPTQQITIKGQPFVLDVASTDAAIQKGLGGRESIPENGGMIFVFPDAQQRRFYMKDCLVDIDILFLDPLGRITAIHTMTTEPLRAPEETQVLYEQRLARYPSTFPAQYAIELKAGRIAQLGLKQGDKLDIPSDCLKARLN